MNPIIFPGHNTVFAKDQPEYLPLPAFVDPGRNGNVITCWQLTWKERIKILWTGKLWLDVYSFHKPLQPQRPSVDCPLVYDPKKLPDSMKFKKDDHEPKAS